MMKPDEVLLNDLCLSVKNINDIEKLENIVLKGIGKSKVVLNSTLISHLQYIINTYFQNFNPDVTSHKYLSTLLSFIKLISQEIDDTYNWDLTKDEYALLLESCLRSVRIYLKVNPKRFSFLLHIVCDTAKLIASKSINMKNALIKGMSVLLLKFVVHNSVDIHEKLYLLKHLILLLKESDKTLRAQVCWKVRRYLCRLVQYLHTIGDFITQGYCVEVISRYIAGMDVRNTIASYFKNPELEKEFLSIPNNSFEIGCRKFLNNLNKMQGSTASVITLACQHVFMGQLEVFKPEDYTDFWIDVNIGMGRITFMCDPKSFQVKERTVTVDWELIVINSQDVEQYDLLPDGEEKNNTKEIQLRIWLRNMCTCLHKTSMDVIKKTKVISFHIIRSDCIAELKNNVLPTMFAKSLKGVKASESNAANIHSLQNIMASQRSRQMNSIKKTNISLRKTEGHKQDSYSHVKADDDRVIKDILISPSKVDGTQFTNSADSIKEMYRKLSAHQNVKYAPRSGCKKEPVLSQVIEIEDSQILNFNKDNISETFTSIDTSFYDTMLGNKINETNHIATNHCTKEECEMKETKKSDENRSISKNKLQCILDDWNQSSIEEIMSINTREVPKTQQQNNIEEKVINDTGEPSIKTKKFSVVLTDEYSQPINDNNGKNACNSHQNKKQRLIHTRKTKSNLDCQNKSLRGKTSELKGLSGTEKTKDSELLKKVSKLCIRDDPMKLRKEHNHNTLASSMPETLPKTKDVNHLVEAKKIQCPIDNISSNAKNEKSLLDETVDIIVHESSSSKGNYKIPILVLNKLKCSSGQNVGDISATNSSELIKDLVVCDEEKHKVSHSLCVDVGYQKVQQSLGSNIQLQKQTGANSAFRISEIESQTDVVGDIKRETSHSTKPYFIKENEISVSSKEGVSLETITKDVCVTETQIKTKQRDNFNQVIDSVVNNYAICKDNVNNKSDALLGNVAEVKNTLETATKVHNYEHLNSDNSSSFDIIFPNSSSKIRDILKVSEQKYFKTTKTVESVITLSEKKVVDQTKQAKGKVHATKRKLFSLNEGELNKNSKNKVTEINWSKAISTTKFSKQRKKQLQSSSITFKKPLESNRNSINNQNAMNETIESKLSVFSDFNSEDDVIPDFLQKLIRPAKKKPSKKKQKYLSTKVQKEKELEFATSSSSDEIFKNRKTEHQKVKFHKTEGIFKTEMCNLKRMEQKKCLKSTSEIKNQLNNSISVNSTYGTGNNQIDEFDKLLDIKIESKNQVAQIAIDDNINYKCTKLLQQNNSCLKSNFSNKIPVKKKKHIKYNDDILNIKLKKDQNATRFENKPRRKKSPEGKLSGSSCDSNHPRCQPLSEVIRKNLLQGEKEKSNSDLKTIDHPSSNTIIEFKSPVSSNIMQNTFKDLNFKNITDTNCQKNKKQKLMLLAENKDSSDQFYFSDLSDKSVCNTGLVDENSTKYVNQPNKYDLVEKYDKTENCYSKNKSCNGEGNKTVIKLQNRVGNMVFNKKGPRNSRILKNITNKTNSNQLNHQFENSNSNLDLKLIDNPSSIIESSVLSKNSRMKQNVFEESNFNHTSLDSIGQEKNNQKLMLLTENEDCSDHLDFSDFSNKLTVDCNSILVDEKSATKYVNLTNKHDLIKKYDNIDEYYSKNEFYIGEAKKTATKLQKPSGNVSFSKKRNSRILKDITNQINTKQFESQIQQNLKRMFEKISQNSSTPKSNTSNILFSVGTDISSIKRIDKTCERNELNCNVKEKHKTSNTSSFDLNDMSHISIASSSNLKMKYKEESSLETCISFSSDHISERNCIEGRNMGRKPCSNTKSNHNNTFKDKIENWLLDNKNDNSSKSKVKNSSSKKIPLLEKASNAFLTNAEEKSHTNYINKNYKIRNSNNKVIPANSTTEKHKNTTICPTKTQLTNKLLSQMSRGNKMSEISNVVVSQTNAKCEDWCSGFKSNDSFTTSSLSDGIYNDLEKNNITIASELQSAVSLHLKNKIKLAENFSTHVLGVLQNNIKDMELNDEKIWQSSIQKYKQQIDIQLNDAAETMESIEQQMSDLKNVENLVKEISESLEPKLQLALKKIQLLHQTNKNMIEELSSLNKASLKPTNQLEETMDFFRSVIDKTIAQQYFNALDTIRNTVSKMLAIE